MAASGNDMVKRARIDNYDVLHGLDLFVKPMCHDRPLNHCHRFELFPYQLRIGMAARPSHAAKVG